MNQDHEAEAKRPEEPTGTPAKPDEDGMRAQNQVVDPERLNKAIRYLKDHPNQQAGQLQARISDFLRRSA
jgi:hypothetical protein